MYFTQLFILALTCVITFVQSTDFHSITFKGLSQKEIDDIEQKAVEECGEENNIDKETLKKSFSLTGDVAPELKRTLGCFEAKMGYIIDGKVNWDRLKVLNEAYFLDKIELEKTLNIMEACINEVSKGPPIQDEIAYNLHYCVKEKTEKKWVKES